jgi:hypothetical protein
MKKILFCFSIALVILLPTSFYAHGAKPSPGFKIVQQKYTFLQCQSDHEDFFFDDYLDDESDDNIHDSERKKISLKKTASYNSSFAVQNLSTYYFKRGLSSKYFTHLPASLFIFINVLRL